MAKTVDRDALLQLAREYGTSTGRAEVGESEYTRLSKQADWLQTALWGEEIDMRKMQEEARLREEAEVRKEERAAITWKQQQDAIFDNAIALEFAKIDIELDKKERMGILENKQKLDWMQNYAPAEAKLEYDLSKRYGELKSDEEKAATKFKYDKLMADINGKWDAVIAATPTTARVFHVQESPGGAVTQISEAVDKGRILSAQLSAVIRAAEEGIAYTDNGENNEWLANVISISKAFEKYRAIYGKDFLSYINDLGGEGIPGPMYFINPSLFGNSQAAHLEYFQDPSWFAMAFDSPQKFIAEVKSHSKRWYDIHHNIKEKEKKGLRETTSKTPIIKGDMASEENNPDRIREALKGKKGK